eukprot:11560183-Ditylum_brightwellii.AAC.1
MAKAEYTSLKIRTQWDANSKPTYSKKHSAEDIVALRAEFKKKDKIIKSFQSSTTSGPPSGYKFKHHAHSNSSARPTSSSDYRPSAQVGRGK